MRRLGLLTVFGAVLFSFLWAGSALGGAERPKNVILMIGDGMGPEQVQAGRLLLDPGETLAVDLLDGDPGFATTYEENGEITDSAAAGTALATGQKTVYGNVSMESDEVTPIPTSMELAIEEGMATGLISDVYMCDATPGVWVAHAPRRSCSMIIPQQVEACVDVFLGAGKAYVQPGANGFDYIEEMAADCGHQRVKSARELARAQAPNDKLVGVWGGYTLTYNIDRQNDPDKKVPTLAEMTAKAIEVLSRDPDGFFLMVEGGALDWMAHNKDIAGVARDMLAFDDAVAVARNFATADGDTLLVVTADHECGGLEVGDNPNVAFIEGITASTDFMYGLVLRGEMSAEDALETYAGVTDLTQAEKDAIAAYGEMGISDALSARANVVWWLPDGTQSVAPDEANHTYTEVPVFAYGPGSEELEGHIDNTDIGNLLFWAAGRD
jgi:alkaline phosphatase